MRALRRAPQSVLTAVWLPTLRPRLPVSLLCLTLVSCHVWTPVGARVYGVSECVVCVCLCVCACAPCLLVLVSEDPFSCVL